MTDSVHLTPRTCEGLNLIGIGDFNVVETPERMAYVVIVLRKLKDRDDWFPRGKWATIQAIEGLVEQCAEFTVDKLS